MPVFDKVTVDFDLGAHIAVPHGHAPVRYAIIDTGSGKLEDAGVVSPPAEAGTFAHVSTNRKYFVPWKIELWSNGAYYECTFDPKGKKVIFDLRSALGDSIAWMRSVEVFTERWECLPIIVQKRAYIPLFDKVHPGWRFIAKEEWEKMAVPDDTYARFILATDCTGEGRTDWQPLDYRKISVQQCGDAILGVDSHNTAPKIVMPDKVKRDPKLVCIACRASAPCKEWQYATGWETVVWDLRRSGYKVVCIDGDNGNLPEGAVDDTGYKPITERAALLNSARLFIGGPSGLSWLAFACGTPYVLIDGMSDPAIEAPTPYAVTPKNGKCRNCWAFADQQQRARYQQCFRHWSGYDYIRNTPTGENGFEQYECTKSITPEMVMKEVYRALEETKWNKKR